jgi:hypothetical protein
MQLSYKHLNVSLLLSGVMRECISTEPDTALSLVILTPLFVSTPEKFAWAAVNQIIIITGSCKSDYYHYVNII